jgi:antitoxin (DNA-binding transcriptional repressor) of toxin-antitoxin stability system
MTKTVDIRDAQAQLPELLSFTQEGNEVIISEGDRPVARLVPIPSSGRKRVLGLHRGTAWTSEDFDEPLPDGFWLGGDE